ncbi:MAG TPA: phosphotransferase [Candidatus Eisenbacteria bacterium]|nr:phosphotransferase [Candidatus Eisenbacteria bacterium]
MTDLQSLVAEKVEALFGPSARLTDLRPLAGDASSRRYHRATLSGPAPGSLVVMELGAGSGLPLSSEELAIFKTPLVELPFINVHRFLRRIGVNVAKLYGHWEAEGILLLEDLGDVALWDCVNGAGAADVARWYQKAIDELLVLQVRGTRERDATCIAFQQRFDARLYLWEFDHFIEYGLQKRPGARVSETAVRLLRAAFREIAARLERPTPCLNHRDYHSWNIMVRDDELAVIDFQDALLAPPQYDLASLLNDRETDRVINERLENELVAYYLDRRKALGEPVADREEFEALYRLSVIQRDLKVVGRFHYLDTVKGKPGYRRFIPATVRRLERNLARSPEAARLVPILSEELEAMR